MQAGAKQFQSPLRRGTCFNLHSCQVGVRRPMVSFPSSSGHVVTRPSSYSIPTHSVLLLSLFFGGPFFTPCRQKDSQTSPLVSFPSSSGHVFQHLCAWAWHTLLASFSPLFVGARV